MDEGMFRIIDEADIPASFWSFRRHSDGLEGVLPIMEAVRERGDAAVREAAGKYDRANPAILEVPPEDAVRAAERLEREEPELYRSVCLSRDLALRFASLQRASFTDFETELSPGLFTGQRTVPVERVGAYVPAGRFPLISTVIMTVCPAKAAGVDEIILVSPPAPHPESAGLPAVDWRILAVARLCGAHRVFAMGGPQSIAALAYGTESVPKADVIVGPGNRYVTEAKRLAFGEVGIDLVAGPSEVMVIADSSARPDWVAADLLAQAEHDADAQAILVTADRALADAVRSELSRLVGPLPDRAAARASLAKSFAIVVPDLDAAAGIANRKAPEHLELALESGAERDRLAAAVRNFGSLFVGHGAAEVLGDYAAGLNHTLPTVGTARFTGGLSVRHFLKTLTTLRTVPAADGAAAPGTEASLEAAERMANAEGLEGHALAARCRRARGS